MARCNLFDGEVLYEGYGGVVPAYCAVAVEQPIKKKRNQCATGLGKVRFKSCSVLRMPVENHFVAFVFCNQPNIPRSEDARVLWNFP